MVAGVSGRGGRCVVCHVMVGLRRVDGGVITRVLHEVGENVPEQISSLTTVTRNAVQVRNYRILKYMFILIEAQCANAGISPSKMVLISVVNNYCIPVRMYMGILLFSGHYAATSTSADTSSFSR